MAEKQLDIIVKAQAQQMAEISAAQKEIESLHQSVSLSATAHEKHAIAAKEAMAAEHDLTKEGGEAARAMGELGGKGAEVLDRFTALGGVMASSGPMGVGIGAALVGFGALLELGKSSVETYDRDAEAVLNFQRVTGAAAEESSRLTATFAALGIKGDEAANAMFRLNQRVLGVTEDGGKAATKLEGLHIEVGRTASGATDLMKTLENVSDAYVRAGSSAEKDQIAFAAFGRSGRELIPVLEQGSAGLEALAASTNLVFTQAQLEQVHQYNIAIQQANQSWQEVQVTIGQNLLPPLTAVARSFDMTNASLAALASGQAHDIPTALALGSAHDQLARSALEERDRFDKLTQSLKDTKDAQDKLYTADIGGIDAAMHLKEATLAQSDALARLTTDQGTAGISADQLQHDQDSVERAMVGAAKASVELAQKQADAAGSSLSVRDKSDIMVKALQDDMAKVGPGSQIAKDLQDYIDRLGNIPRDIRTTAYLNLVQSGGGNLGSGFHQHGGDVQAGEISMVGEAGPELVQFGSPAHIYPHGQAPAGADMGGTEARLEALYRLLDERLPVQRFGARAYGAL